MTQTAHLVVFDGLVDWEPDHALWRSGRFAVRTVGFTPRTITTMAGLKVVPDLALDKMKPENSALLILPGGDMWQEKAQPAVESLLRRFHEREVPVAAICGQLLRLPAPV